MSRSALSIGATVAILAGCGVVRPPSGAPGALPQGRTIGVHADRGTSWMLPEAKNEDLLYVATGDNIYVLSYPGGKLVGALNVTGNNICSDKKGDVFVPSGYDVDEYSHGGVLLQTLDDGDVALGCSVDPTTGNLAVTNEGSGAGEVAIFPKAREPVQWLNDPDIGTYGLCGYDDRGNLFFDGTSGTDYFAKGASSTNYFAELRKGSSTFKNFPLSSRFDAFGSVQWDGTFITLSNPTAHEVYRLKLSKTSLKVAGTTHVHDWQNAYSGHWPYVQTWLEGDTFIAQASTLANVGLWRYPQGDKPSKVLRAFRSGAVNINGVTVSVAKH